MRIMIAAVSLLSGGQAYALQSLGGLVGGIALTQACFEPGAACPVPAFCCSNECHNNLCVCNPHMPAPCASDADCCTGHVCDTATRSCCVEPMGTCLANIDCCSGLCAGGSCVCDIPGTSPNQCIKSADCCESADGVQDCQGGVCLSCNQSGGACRENSECCGTTLACVDDVCCGDKGATCGAGAPCCSGTCGVGSTCTCIGQMDAGCRQSSDCCSPSNGCYRSPTNSTLCGPTDQNCVCYTTS
jgi:hypothetical protein